MRLLSVLIFIGAINSHAYEVTSGQIEFVNKLKMATKADDKEWISGVISCPLSISLESGDQLQIETEADFVENYEVIFNANVKEAILLQEMADLFFNWQGLMIGRGQVWITGAIMESGAVTYWITAINPAAPAVTTQPEE